MTDPDLNPDDLADVLREAPPAATLVGRVLAEADRPLTRSEVASRAYLPERTARDALQRLRGEDVVAVEVAAGDPSTPRYRVVFTGEV